jgi:hypothetical protein
VIVNTIYDNVTGEILGTLDCPAYLVECNMALKPNNYSVIENSGAIDGRTHYFDLANTVLPRPEITAEPNKLIISADGVDLFILENLPVPCTVTVDDTPFNVTDTNGEFGFPTTIQGNYMVKVEKFPYLPKEWEVRAV